MSNEQKTVFFLFCTILVSSLSLKSQTQFESEKLKSIYNLLPKECRNNIEQQSALKESYIVCPTITGNSESKIIIEKDNNEISHIGLSLFKNEQKLYSNKFIYNFLERTILEFLLKKDIKEIQKVCQEENIEFKNNGLSLGSQMFYDLRQALNAVKEGSNFQIKRDSLLYSALWENGIDNFILTFPANNSLIKGMDKKELDEEMCRELKSFKVNVKYSSETDTNNINNYKNKTYIIKGKNYLTGFNSNTYYKKNTHSYELLYDKDYVSETFSNIFLKPSEKNQNQKILINQRLYGNNIERYEVNLSDFMKYFQKDYELYFGIEDSSKNNLQGTMIIYNRELNYLNLMFVKTNFNILFDSKGEYEANLYSNIPCDNIKTIFGEYVDERDRLKYKTK